MKKHAKVITGFSTTSIVGLRAAIASEQSRVQSGAPAPRPAKHTSISNKGVLERAKKDEEISEPVLSKAKKIVYVAGVAYYQGEDDKEELVDIERKKWEEYERSELANARFDSRHHDDLLESHRREEEEEADKRRERRELIAELAADTVQGRDEHRAQMAKREHSKMTRKELIQAKANAMRAKSRTTSPIPSQDAIFEEESPRAKRAKTEEHSDKP